MQTFIKVMKALSDPNRIKMLKLLQHQSLCVCELRYALDISQPNASKHLKLLEEAGLVDSKKEGLWINYSITDGTDSPYAASLLGNLKHWLDDDSGIIKLVAQIPELDRDKLCKH